MLSRYWRGARKRRATLIRERQCPARVGPSEVRVRTFAVSSDDCGMFYHKGTEIFHVRLSVRLLARRSAVLIVRQVKTQRKGFAFDGYALSGTASAEAVGVRWR